MKTLLTFLLAVSLAPGFAFGKNKSKTITPAEVKALVARIQKHHDEILAKARKTSSLLEFYVSPESPVQGDPVTIFSEVQTDFVGEETILIGTFDGNAVNLDQPSKDLFIYNAGSFGVIGKHTFQGSFYIQNHNDAVSLRNAISQLNAQIVSLQNQISQATDPNVIQQLQAQLTQAQSQQAQLTASLANLKTLVARPNFSFQVAENTASPNFPHITTINPFIAKVGASEQVTISGTNFPASPAVSIGSQALTITSASSTSIVGTISGFAAAGPQNVIVSGTASGQAVSAELDNGFFAVSSLPFSPAPVAVASADSAQINLGSAASFNSSGSNDPQLGTLSYQWQVVSKPAGSQVPVPGSGAGATYSFVPDFPGVYVVSLIVQSSASNLTSAPSMAVVEVQAASNQAPVITGSPLSVNCTTAKSEQLSLTDEPWQAHSYLITRQGSLGTASVSSSGIVTYSAGAVGGSDSFDVLVIDNGPLPLSGSVTIPVSLIQNHAPTGSAPGITIAAGGTLTSQITASDQDAGQTLSFAIQSNPAQGTASVSSSGLVTYSAQANASGSDSVVVRVSDNGIPVMYTDVTIPITIAADQPPVIPNPLFYRILSQGVPYQVGLSISGNATPAGGITFPGAPMAKLVWDFGDGTKEQVFDPVQAAINHNYVQTGSFTATLTAYDTLGLSSSRTLQVVVVDTDIPVAKFTVNPSNGGGTTLPITITFDASASSDSNGITQYRWVWGSGAEQVTTNPVITHTFTTADTFNVRLRVRDQFIAEGQATVPVTVGSTVQGAPVQAAFKVGPPREVVLGTPLSFDGSLSFQPNSAGTIAAYNWNFSDLASCPSGASAGCVANGVSTNYTYPAAQNYFPGLQVQTGLGNLSKTVNQEVMSVIRGHMPHAVLYSKFGTASGASFAGVAPFTIHPDGSWSYDYDGNLTSYNWKFGDGTTASGPAASKTYPSVGTYFLTLSVTDNDGNVSTVTSTVSVTASKEQLASKKARDGEDDSDEEYQKQVYAGACAAGNAASCYELSQIYAADGDEFTSQQLRAKACSMGYQAACSN